jgi:hypothetical protein
VPDYAAHSHAKLMQWAQQGKVVAESWGRDSTGGPIPATFTDHYAWWETLLTHLLAYEAI